MYGKNTARERLRLFILWGLLPFLLFSALMAPLATMAAASPSQAPAALRYASFEDIPDVTAEEILAVEQMRAAGRSLPVSALLSTEAFWQEDGSVGGYVALLCQRLSDLFGIAFVPQVYTADAPEAFTTAPGDGFAYCPVPSLALRNSLYQTGPVTERTINIFRLKDAIPVESIARRRLPRYGFLQDSDISRLVSTRSAFPFETVLAADWDELSRLLTDESIDAFFAESSAETAFEGQSSLISNLFLPLTYLPTCLLTDDPELTSIISIIQKYLNHGGREELAALYDQGAQDYRRYKFFSQLTGAERSYLADRAATGQPVYFAASFDDYPTCFYNQEASAYQGIAIDILEEIESLSGLTFVPYNQVGDYWYKLLRFLEEGEASFAVELLFTSVRAQSFIWTDQPYNADNYALLSLIDTPDIDISQIPNSRVGLILETAFSDIFFAWFPDHKRTISFANYEDAFSALEAGDVDFVMGSEGLLLNISNYLERVGFKANIIFDYVSESAFGFHSSETVLRSVMSKAQDLVDVRDISARWSLRTFDYRQKLSRAQVPYLVGAGVLAVIVIALLVALYIINKNANKQLEKTVQLRTAELERQTNTAQIASRAKSVFLGRMSHELRTPLNAVLGMAQIARQNIDTDNRAHQSIGEVITASTHLLDLLNDVLDMSQIEVGRLELTPEPFLIKAAMLETEAHIARLCAEKGLTFAGNADHLPELSVIGDKARLKQILLNLLNNAVKFTELGGQVDFEVACALTAETAALSFVVRDTGIGITPEQISDLFVAFEQASSTITQQYGGMGLGLSIAQELARKMDSCLAVESQVGVGTSISFTVALPLEPVQAAPPADMDALDNLDFSGKHLLVADDIELNRIILVELLSDTGVVIDEAADGAEALAMFEESPPGYYSLIFMDIQMPHLDGHEATRAIRALERADAQSVVIVAVTANSYPEDVEKAMAAGMNGHMAKPIDADAVRLVLREKLRPLI